VALALRRGNQTSVVAALGRDASAWGEVQLRNHRLGAVAAEVTVVDVPATLAAGILFVDSALAGSLPGLALYARCASALIDLRIIRTREADAEHRVLPLEAVAGAIGSLNAGDGIVLVVVEGGSAIAARPGDPPGEPALLAVAAHLLRGTRPSGDIVAELAPRTFLVVLRALKGPVEVVGQRLLDGWRDMHTDVGISLGAAVRADGEAPLDAMSRAEEALESCRRNGGGLHVASMPGPRRVQ
jgi:hypothetical protein